MKESVEFVGEPALMRNSLILTGLTLRTFSAVVSDCLAPVDGLVHEALATRSPLNAAGPEVILKVALAVAPGAIGPAMVAGVEATAVHCFGVVMLSLIAVCGAPVVFVKVTVVSCDDPGENVWR